MHPCELITWALVYGSRGNRDLAAEQAILKTWDRRTDTGNRGTALAIVMGEPIVAPYRKRSQ